MLPYCHPVIGAAVLLLLLYAGMLGLRMRTVRRGRGEMAARHARLAQLAYVLVVLSWAAGAASTGWGRDDLELGASLHFRTGTALVVLLTGSLLTSRAMRRGSPAAREWHPWLGAGALLLAAAHVAAGLRITP